MQFSLVTACTATWALIVDELTFDLPPSVYGAIVFLAASCTIFAFWAQTWAQGHTTPIRTALIFILEPVFAALFAWWWVDDHLGVEGWIGGALIVIGLALSSPKQEDDQKSQATMIKRRRPQWFSTKPKPSWTKASP